MSDTAQTQTERALDDQPLDVPKIRPQLDALFAKDPTSDTYARRATTILASTLDSFNALWMAGLWSYGGKIGSLAKRVRALEDQLAAMQERGFNYRGVFQAGQTYQPGNFATDHGGVWHCRKTTAERPGASDDWTLAVKAGRNGRDAKG